MKIFVAIPVYDGKLQHQTVNSLVIEQSIALQVGDEIFTSFVPYCSDLADGRNNLVEGFLKSNCDRMVFLDSDMTFEPGALLKIAHAPVDFAAGCTRHKIEAESYPITFLDSDFLQAEPNGLIEISSIGTAFMSLSRDVFTKFQAAYPDREYTHFGQKACCYFEHPFVNGSLMGEDLFFCKMWRACGGKIYLNPELEITHWKFDQPFVGHIGKWLRARMKEQKHEQANVSKMEAPRLEEIGLSA